MRCSGVFTRGIAVIIVPLLALAADERQSIHCDADGGYVVLSFRDSTVTIDFDDDMSSIETKLSTLVGSSVSILQVDEAIATVCDPNDNHFFVQFPNFYWDLLQYVTMTTKTKVVTRGFLPAACLFPLHLLVSISVHHQVHD